jgi:hypothetical protein
LGRTADAAFAMGEHARCLCIADEEAQVIASRSIRHRTALPLAGVVASITVLGAGLVMASAGGGQPPDSHARFVSLPDWFLPIWDAYDRNPAVTPEFEFSALYSPGASARSGRAQPLIQHR